MIASELGGIVVGRGAVFGGSDVSMRLIPPDQSKRRIPSEFVGRETLARLGTDIALIQIRKKEERKMILLIILLVLLLAGGGGYYGHTRWGPAYGAGTGVGTILVVLLVLYLLGMFH